MVLNWSPYGPRAILLRFAKSIGPAAFERSVALQAALVKQPPRGLIEFVPAFTSILLEFDPRIVPRPADDAPALVERLRRVVTRRQRLRPIQEIPVRYDGPDLERVARLHSMSVQEVIERHSAPVYRVYMLGFSPGFPYLGDLDPKLHTPRLDTPRTRVPPGSVAIGGEHTGIYTLPTPGGWNLIGSTDRRLFDPVAQETSSMFLLCSGDRVKFVPQPPGGS